MRVPRRSRPFAGILTAALVLSIASPAVAADRRGPVPVGTDLLARDSWIVTLRPGSDSGQAAALANAAGGHAGLVYEHAFNGFQFKGSAQAAAALSQNPQVVSVMADAAMYLQDLLPHGVDRVAAWDQAGTQGSYQQGYRGHGARIAVIDTGIDLDHPDLVSNIDVNLGTNCVTPGTPPNDGYGHGTHVSGTAASPYNGIGMVGVAPEARLVPVKVFDDAGNSAESLVLCGLDHVIGLNTDGDPANDVDVVNMSFGEAREWGDCASEPLHAAICRAHDAGLILVGGAGNSATDAGSFVPAAFPEVMSVSAMADFDGAPGGQAGCPFVFEIFWYECDDSFALFSNYGASVDIAAPGVQEYSTWAGGGYQTSSGTSMATPHIAGIAALVAAAVPGIAPDRARDAILAGGECPDGTEAQADSVAGCGGQGGWADDPDGTPEPLGNALGAVVAALGAPPSPPPPAATAPSAPTNLAASRVKDSIRLTWSAPASDGGSALTGYVVHRSGGTGGTVTFDVAATQRAYTDAAVARRTTYTYFVTARNAIGEGPPSSTVSIRSR